MSAKSNAEAADGAGAGTGGQDDDMVHSAKMGGALKILERMVNQNAEDEIFQDFKYWEVSSGLAAVARAASKQASKQAKQRFCMFETGSTTNRCVLC